jgi:hypothetical protein
MKPTAGDETVEDVAAVEESRGAGQVAYPIAIASCKGSQSTFLESLLKSK